MNITLIWTGREMLAGKVQPITIIPGLTLNSFPEGTFMGRTGEIIATEDANNRTVGALSYSSSFGEFNNIHIERIDVVGDMQNRGLGSRMLEFLHDISQGHSITSNATTQESELLFSKMGYTQGSLFYRQPTQPGTQSLIEAGGTTTRNVLIREDTKTKDFI